MRPSSAAEQRRRHVHRCHRARPGCSTRSTPTAAAWADYDNDGFLDLFICCERQPNRLYRNKGDGTFEEVAAKAGCRATDRLSARARLDRLRQRRLSRPVRRTITGSGTAGCTATTATAPSPTSPTQMGIDGPSNGFSCWAFDYDNDGWLDIFATCLRPHPRGRGQGTAWASRTAGHTSRLYRNLGGKGFQDVTKEAGLEHGLRTDGEQLRRLRQRRLPRLLPGHRRPGPVHAGAQPHVQERGGQTIRRDHRFVAGRAICKRATASPAATGTATARMDIFIETRRGRRPATGITTSCSRTPARGTTG